MSLLNRPRAPVVAVDEQVNLVDPPAQGADDAPRNLPSVAVAHALADEFAPAVVEGKDTTLKSTE
jgi:hypothetical protein